MESRIHVDCVFESGGELLYECIHPEDGSKHKNVKKEDLLNVLRSEQGARFDVVAQEDNIVRASGAPVAFVDLATQTRTIASKSGLRINIPEKERLIVQRMRDFIDNDLENPVALISGIRLTGKTTVLRQLHAQYNGSVYIDLSIEGVTQATIDEEFLDKPSGSGLLLLDEITYLDDFEPMSQHIYDIAARRRFKVIMTGSSPGHITRLSMTKLGGRARLFRLPPILFIEYLYMTGRIPGYGNYDTVTNDDFSDYLLLNGLTEMRVQFDEKYFNAFYSEIRIGNERRSLAHSLVNLKENDLMNICNLIAYRLSEDRSYEKTIRPKEIGRREYNSLNALGDIVTPKWGSIDLSDVIVSVSKAGARELQATDKARILSFLLWSGLAVIEKVKTGDNAELIDTADVMSTLKNCVNEQQLIDLFDEVSICLATPLFYTRLGVDIIKRMKVDTENLCRGDLLGKMLEVYMRGAVSMYSANQILSTIKLSYANIGEVDIYDIDTGLLLEATIQDSHKTRIQKYMRDDELIRVCATRSKEHFNSVYHQIPYAKLCCMLDTGDILNKERTVV